MSKDIEPSSVLPRSAWRKVLTETILEVFSVMVRVNVAVADKASLASRQITGIVGIGGAIRANLILECSVTSAVKLAAQMLGTDPDAPDSQNAACDAIGEICNIVAGYFKAKIGLGDACMLSVPTTITGRDYQFHSHTYDRLELSLAFEEEILRMTLEIAEIDAVGYPQKERPRRNGEARTM
jgi:chemotaxis protein CheX